MTNDKVFFRNSVFLVRYSLFTMNETSTIKIKSPITSNKILKNDPLRRTDY